MKELYFRKIVRQLGHLAASLDGWYPCGHLQQAKVTALPALPRSRRSLPGCFSGRLQSPMGMLSASGEELRRRRSLLPSAEGATIGRGV